MYLSHYIIDSNCIPNSNLCCTMTHQDSDRLHYKYFAVSEKYTKVAAYFTRLSHNRANILEHSSVLYNLSTLF